MGSGHCFSQPVRGGVLPRRYFTVEICRPPKETRAELSKLIAASPSEADLYALRAREEELQLDFKAAEIDWKKSAQLQDLADFYDRRIRPKDEIAVLESIGKAPSPAAERLTSPSHQQSWKAFERMLAVIHEQALPGEFRVNAYRAWIARYPNEPSIYHQFFDYLNVQKQFDEAEKLIADYRKAFPADDTYPIQATAAVGWKRGALEDAITIYDQSFRPLWPPELVKSYFDLLKEAHGLRRYLQEARAQVTAKPTDLGAAARVFYYYQQQGNLAAAPAVGPVRAPGGRAARAHRIPAAEGIAEVSLGRGRVAHSLAIV